MNMTIIEDACSIKIEFKHVKNMGYLYDTTINNIHKYYTTSQ